MTADLDFTVRRGAFSLSVATTIPPGERVGVIGDNGSGKSTLLATLAGHLRVDSGHITLDGRTVDARGEGASGPRPTYLPPYRRGVGWLGPNPAVFPHLSVRANVAYGLRGRATQRTAELLETYGLADLADRRAGELSTGQQCRTALARALAVDPPYLLLDEPFTGLDVTAAAELRQLVDHSLAGRATTLILVSHDLVDLVTLVTRLISLDAGQVVDDGPLERVLTSPRSPFVADLAGVTTLPGTVTADGVTTALGAFPVLTTLAPGTAVTVAFPPEAVRLAEPGTPGARAVLVDTVATSPTGLILCTGPNRLHVPMNLVVAATIRPWDRVGVVFDPTKASVYA